MPPLGLLAQYGSHSWSPCPYVVQGVVELGLNKSQGDGIFWECKGIWVCLRHWDRPHHFLSKEASGARLSPCLCKV